MGTCIGTREHTYLHIIILYILYNLTDILMTCFFNQYMYPSAIKHGYRTKWQEIPASHVTDDQRAAATAASEMVTWFETWDQISHMF